MAAKKTSTTRTITGKKGQKPIKFKANGSLKRAAGTTKSGKISMAGVNKLAKGKGKTAQKARFYKNVLKGK